MLRLGYARGWSAAINGLSGLIVATIPPSMGLIIYGTVGEVSIGRLFMAGWVPGILMCVLLMLATTWSARKFPFLHILTCMFYHFNFCSSPFWLVECGSSKLF